MKLIRESIHDDLYVNILNESVLNEELSIEKLKEIIGKIGNKKQVLDKFIKKFNTVGQKSKKYISTILVILALANFAGRNNVVFDSSRINILSSQVSAQSVINTDQLIDILKKSTRGPARVHTTTTSISKPEVASLKYPVIDVNKAKTSSPGKEMIKNHEQLRLTAYSIGDGMITIGYGHAKPENKAKFKIGNQITQQQAEKLFAIDIEATENGIKRIFKEWNKKGIDVKINQNQFDALVSMGFNMGMGGLRSTKFMQLLKYNKHDEAAEKIKTTRVNDQMPGLVDRRKLEHDLFAKK